MVEVRVPASSANIGSGFDSFGIALSIYNTITVSETDSGLNITNKNSTEFIPNGTNNLIYRSMVRVFDEVGYEKKGLKITQDSKIPMTRGLGSSSACIIGGLLAANVISGRQLDMQRIFELANELEGHPDNVAAALFGGFCISCNDDSGLFRKTVRVPKGLEFVAMVPEYYLGTKKSRCLLPNKVKLSDAAYNISHASAFAVSMATGDFKNLGVFLNDRLHQHARLENVPDMNKIFKKSRELGALGAYLSGSGPTVIAIIEKENRSFIAELDEYFKKEGIKRNTRRLFVDNVGAVIKEKAEY